MKYIKQLFSIWILVTGVMGVFFFPTVIIWDGGICSDMNMPPSEYKNAAGKPLYTFRQMKDNIAHYAQCRAKLWALDVLSIYMVLHGIFSIGINKFTLYNLLKEPGGRKAFINYLLAICIPSGILFWILIAKILSKISMPLH